ncbi:MAG: hypothetical protein J1E03_01000 [Acetatifactor sp.]|nr:hypothetical protein [Acetatifactor sp.]
MKKVFGVIKINILSLIALPLLLVAVAVKMLAKALEKTMVAIASVVILLAAMLISAIIQNPSEVLSTLFVVIIVLVICGLITLLIVCMFTIASGIIMAIASFIIGILSGIYELLYSGYSALYSKCKRCYEEQLGGIENSALKGFVCLFYSILRGLNACIIFFVTHALKLLVLGCLLLVGGTLYSLNRQTQAILGLNLFTALGMFPVSDLIAGAVLYLALFFCISTVLVSMGLEWNEWGREMKMATTDYEGYLASLAETTASHSEVEIDGSEDEAALRCREYMDKLNQHFYEAEEFQAQTQGIIQKSENQVLRSLLGQYMNQAVDLSEKMNSLPERISVPEFEKLIPQIKRLDSLKEDIQKMNVKLAAQTPEGAGTGFFAGCDSLEKLEKRYKALCKTYHPDTEAGDEETFKKMQEEYEELKGKLGE